MKKSIQFAAVVTTFIIATLISGSVFAQFPETVARNDALVGTWKVTNINNPAIEFQIHSAEKFSLQVDNKESKGSYKVESNVISLDFDNGTRQQFSVKQSNGSLEFKSSDGTQHFVMTRTNSESGGFPVIQSRVADTDTDTEESIDTAEETLDHETEALPENNIAGTWYGQISAGELMILVKMDFRNDGTYQAGLISTFQGNKMTSTDKGEWSITNNKLVTTSETTGDTEVAKYNLDHGVFSIDTSKELGVELHMYSEPSKVKPVQSDLETVLNAAMASQQRMSE